jgi:DNA modification methylase
MDIKNVDIKSVIPYEFNNRIHDDKQINLIANSINEFGFNQPIVIDESNVVLVGHGRLLAAQKLGLDTIPTLQLKNLTEAKKRAYRILDNKLQNDSEWDFGNLELEIEALQEADFPIEDWGLDDLTELFPKEDPEVTEDEPGELPEESYIKPGDLIELGKHRVLCADSSKENFSDVVFDLVITDPPYGVSYKGKTKKALTLENDDLGEDSLRELWSNTLDSLWINLKNGGVIYATVPAGQLREVFSSELKKREALRQELVWLKDLMVLGHSDYHYKHEPVLYGWKPGAAHYITADRSKTSVLEHKRPTRSEERPTMKPLSLFAEFINNSSKKGQKVFDPFLGSGTTLIAADQLNRICYGMEIDPKYCQVILERYQKHCEKVGKPFECKINGEVFNGTPKGD